MITIPGYEINAELYQSTRTAVYRGIRQDNGKPVILKVLQREYPTPEEIAGFRKEYEITLSLKDIDGVIEVDGLEKAGHSLAIVLEDLDGESLAHILVSRKLQLDEFLQLAIRISAIIGDVHRHHIIHKDINPSNIVWNPTTEQFKLIDFGIAAESTYDHAAPGVRADIFEGTLPYISPEQTGRMNRAVDYRTDFYSLGVTLYEMLLGTLPFQMTDTMEVIHAHLAKTPPSPYEVNPDVPQPVSKIIMKLLAKTAEDRYQSARGLESDLRRCYDQLRTTGQIRFIALGQNDISDRFAIPHKLYGRTTQRNHLLDAFERICQGRREVVFISGHAGAGKAVLVRELQQPAIEKQANFVTGRFEQTRQEMSYAPLMRAFQPLIRHILTEAEARIARWKKIFLAALAANGQLLIDFLPEMALIIGEQPPVPPLASVELQNRLHLVIQRFIQIFASLKHPLVIFLNDLQWADHACLQLLQFLMTSDESRYLLVIGAYRSDETASDAPLLSLRNDLQQAGIPITTIDLPPLAIADLKELLTDTLRCEPEAADELAQLVFEKTYGNPFSVKEFLKSLYQEKLLTFNPRSGRWEWTLEQIRGMAITESVVRVMTAKIQKLPPNIQEVLQVAACIGNRFDLHTLAHVQNKTAAAAAAELEVALQEGLIVPTDDTYTYSRYLQAQELEAFAPQVMYDFVHHQIREAADDLTPEGKRTEFHVNIGRHLLRCDVVKYDRKAHIPEIVNHLNYGVSLLDSPVEKLNLAKLNLTVGKRAKAAAAYPSAQKYFAAGVAVLGRQGWNEQYQLTFELHKEGAEAEYLCGNFEDSERRIAAVLEHARTDVEKAEMYNLRILQETLRAQYADAIQTGRTALNVLGFPIPDDGLAEALQSESNEIRGLLRGKRISELILEPELTLQDGKVAIRVLDNLILSAQVQPDLYRVVVSKIVNISLKYGHVPEEAYGYSQYGVLLGSVWGYYKAGYEFGLLAVKLSERFNHPAQTCKALCALAGDLSSWVRHVKYTQKIENDAYQIGLQSGEFQFAGLTLMHKVLNRFYEGMHVEQILDMIPKFLEFSSRTRNQVVTDVLSGCRLILQNVCGMTSGKTSFDADSLTEVQYLTNCQDHQSALPLCLYRIMKAQVLYLYGDPEAALECLRQAEESLGAILSLIARAEHNFYTSLSLAALIPNASESTQQRYREQLRANQQQLKIWAETCPENFQHQYLLIQAEEARLSGSPFDAMQCYHQAMQSAKDQGFMPHEALAHELAARFYLEHGFEEFAQLHLKKAHRNYGLWGAIRKVEELEKQYSQIFTIVAVETPPRGTTRMPSSAEQAMLKTTEKGLSVLDLQTVMKATQAISGEIVLPDLLRQVMKIVLENAGAEKGWLLLEKDGAWTIEAEYTMNTQDVKLLQAVPLHFNGTSEETPLPASIIQYVIRTKEPIVLNHAAQQGNFTHDPYIEHHHAKSVLCTPLIKQGQLIGLLYLENNLAAGIFTPSRFEVLNMLSSQMSISIENATLYTDLEQALKQQIELSENQVKLTNAYSRFVPSEFLSLLEKESILEVQLGDQVEKEITVMFSDIRGFTSLSENMTPQENFNFLNSYLSHVSPAIQKHRGFIDKYIGDAIMALFPQSADDAVRAAIDMLKILVTYNQGRKRAGYRPIQIGLGLNTGDLMLGTVGYKDRMDGTVISDAVNLASRIEGMTKVYGSSVLLSETTYFQLENAEAYHIRIIDQVQAKGKSEPVTIFEVFDGDPPELIDRKEQTLMMFKQGFKLYHQTKFAAANALISQVVKSSPEIQMEHIAEAEALFEEVLHINPDDKIAQIYLQRCQNVRRYGISEEWRDLWSWVETMKKK